MGYKLVFKQRWIQFCLQTMRDIVKFINREGYSLAYKQRGIQFSFKTERIQFCSYTVTERDNV